MTDPIPNLLPAVRVHPRHPAIYPDSHEDPRLEAILEAIRSGTIGFAAECEAQGFKPAPISHAKGTQGMCSANARARESTRRTDNDPVT